MLLPSKFTIKFKPKMLPHFQNHVKTQKNCGNVFYLFKQLVSRHNVNRTKIHTKESQARINRVTGKTKQTAHGTSGSINANLLNSHYARISTDPHYVEPAKKLTCGIEGVRVSTNFKFSNCWISCPQHHLAPTDCRTGSCA